MFHDTLVIREYMNKDEERYHAKVSQNETDISVSEGGKPLFGGSFARRVEVYLPENYSKSLKVTGTDGNIDMSEIEPKLASLRVDCTAGILKLKSAKAGAIQLSTTSGKLELGELTAGRIRIETTEGEVDCAKARGYIDYTTTSGNGIFRSVSGSGAYRADNSGRLSVNYEEVTGNLLLYNKNDSVELQLPEELSFAFKAVTRNGRCDTDFQEAVSMNGGSTEGIVGSSPAVTVEVETKNGNIQVSR